MGWCTGDAPSPAASPWERSTLPQGRDEGRWPELVLPVKVRSSLAAASSVCASSCGPWLGFGTQAPSQGPWREGVCAA